MNFSHPKTSKPMSESNKGGQFDVSRLVPSRNGRMRRAAERGGGRGYLDLARA